MATASETITAAYRESNLVAATGTLTSAQETEGLARLNAILAATPGTVAGIELADLNIGGDYDQSWAAAERVPENARLVLNLAAARTLKLSPSPHEGQRVAVADAGANLATYNLTLDGNGRTIEGAATQVLATDGMVRQWLYRGDTANWVRLTDLALDDDLPFPTEFDDYFAILLAMRLNPRHGRTLMEESAAWFTGREGAFEARYRRPRPVQDWGTPGLHGQFGRAYGSSATWTRGRGW